LGEACPTQLFGDTTHLPGRYPVDHHLHHCQKERLLTALIPFEQLRRERAAANPRHPQLQRPDSGLHFPSAVAIAVSQALFRTLKGRRLQLPGHLCVEYLVYDTLQQLSHTLVSTKKLVQYLAIYRNLVLGHPLQPPLCFVDQLNHYQAGDGPSYCYAILILEFTPYIPDTTAKKRTQWKTTSSGSSLAGGTATMRCVRPRTVPCGSTAVVPWSKRSEECRVGKVCCLRT